MYLKTETSTIKFNRLSSDQRSIFYLLGDHNTLYFLLFSVQNN